MKINKIIILLFIFALIFPASAAYGGSDRPVKFIDVGLFFGKNSPEWTDITTESHFFLEFTANGSSESSSENGPGPSPIILLNSEGENVKSLRLTASGQYFVLATNSENSANSGSGAESAGLQSAMQRLRQLSYHVCYHASGRMGLAIGGFNSAAEAQTHAQNLINLKDAALQGLEFAVAAPTGHVDAVHAGEIILRADAAAKQWAVSSDITTVNSSSSEKPRRYRGGIRVHISEDGTKSLINRLDIEEYLRGVLAIEMNHKWPEEALKAQVVAARSYALAAGGKFQKYGFDVDDSTASQVYWGVDSERPRTDKAVLETRGQVMYYGGEVATLYFHASSGGSIEASKDVWSGDKGYLQAKADVFSTEMGYENWTLSIESSKIESALTASGKYIGSVIAAEILERSAGGRVKKIRIIGTQGSTEMPGTAFRNIMGNVYFKSTLFGFSEGAAASVFGKPEIAAEFVKNLTDKYTSPWKALGTNSGSSAPTGGSGPGGDSDHSDQNASGKTPGYIKISSLPPGRQILSEDPPHNVEPPSPASATSASPVAPAAGQVSPAAGHSSPDHSPIFLESRTFLENLALPNSEYAGLENGSLKIYGHGFGHGLGMSQVGAKRMADLGFTYDQILEFYYSGAKIKIYE